MKSRKYWLNYIVVLIVNTFMVNTTTFLYIIFDVDVVNYNISNWIETFTAIFTCYFLIPLIFSLLIFKNISVEGINIDREIKKRVRRLPLYIVVSLIPGYMLWNFVLCLPDALTIYSSTEFIVKLNIISVFTYSNIIVPIFISYMLTSNIRKRIKYDYFEKYNILFDPGITKIWQKLFLMVLFISVFPVIILYLDGYVSYINEEGVGNRLLSNLDLGYVVITIIISMIIITKDITDPINKMISSFRLIKNGDFSNRMAITTQNEMGVLTYNFNLMAEGLEEREKIKDVFGQYVSPSIAEKIINKEGVLSGEEREVTVLFTDIKNYTSISERLTPRENVSLLNEYYNLLIQIVKKHKGVVNKFMGDAIMVIFNAPYADEKHSFNAVNCGLEIVKETNNRFFGDNIKLKTRVGINTGPVVAGTLGGMNRFEYTIIGDAVNVAQRLEQYNKVTETQLLLSHNTAANVYRSIRLKKVGKANVKGKTEKVLVYTAK